MENHVQNGFPLGSECHVVEFKSKVSLFFKRNSVPFGIVTQIIYCDFKTLIRRI